MAEGFALGKIMLYTPISKRKFTPIKTTPKKLEDVLETKKLSYTPILQSKVTPLISKEPFVMFSESLKTPLISKKPERMFPEEIYKKPAGYEEPGIVGQFVESIKESGIRNISALGSSVEAYGVKIDNEKIKRAGNNFANDFRLIIEQHPEWQAPTDMRAWKDPAFYARLVGNIVPSIAFSYGLAAAVTVATRGNLVAGFIAGFGHSKMLEGGLAYQEARDAGATEQRAQEISSIVGTLNGALEMVGIGRILNKIPGGKQIKSNIFSRVTREFAKQGIAEGVPEGIQEFVNNAFQQEFDENRGLFDGVLEALAGGTIAGGFTGGGVEFAMSPEAKKIVEEIKRINKEAGEAGFLKVPTKEPTMKYTPIVTTKPTVINVKRNYSTEQTKNTDSFRGGTWYSSEESDVYDFGDTEGVGGKNILRKKISIKNPLIIEDAVLEDGSFSVINSGYENFIPKKYSKIANELYDKVKPDISDYEKDGIIMDTLYDIGISEKDAIKIIESFNKFDATMDLVISKGLKASGYDALILGEGKEQHIFDFSKKAPEQFTGLEKVTTKIVEELKGKTEVSPQFILDQTNRPEIRQVERDLIREVLEEYKGVQKIPAKEFAEKVGMQLLPLEIPELSQPDMSNLAGEYSFRVLDKNERGDVVGYGEIIYESPIPNSAGGKHFNVEEYPNYFAHVRVEDLARPAGKRPFGSYITPEQWNKGFKGIRRIIELQSDLMQKGRLEEEIKTLERMIKDKRVKTDTNKLKKDLESLKKLLVYRNIWFERIIREEIKRAAQDSKTTLLFPTGETAMKIEGLGSGAREWLWHNPATGTNPGLTPNTLKVGRTVWEFGNAGVETKNQWIITDILGDGKFKAMMKKYTEDDYISGYAKSHNISKVESKKLAIENLSETFDISGKVDTSNPIYRFYEKEVQRFLKRIHPEMKQITDERGIAWFEIKIKPAEAKAPVVAFKDYQRPKIGGMISGEQAIKNALEIADRLKLSNIDARLTKTILTGNGGKAFAFSMGRYLRFTDVVPEFTGEHEILHTIHRDMDDIEIFARKGIKKADIDRELMRDNPDANIIQRKEILSENFELYAQMRQQNKPTTIAGKMKQFFDEIWDWLRRVFTNDNRFIMRRFFEIVEKGKAKKPTEIEDFGPPEFMRDDDLAPLAKEARKYKSVSEFVKAKQKIYEKPVNIKFYDRLKEGFRQMDTEQMIKDAGKLSYKDFVKKYEAYNLDGGGASFGNKPAHAVIPKSDLYPSEYDTWREFMKNEAGMTAKYSEKRGVDLTREYYNKSFQPPLVEEVDGKYFITDGHHRVANLLAEGQDQIPVYFDRGVLRRIWEKQSGKKVSFEEVKNTYNELFPRIKSKQELTDIYNKAKGVEKKPILPLKEKIPSAVLREVEAIKKGADNLYQDIIELGGIKSYQFGLKEELKDVPLYLKRKDGVAPDEMADMLKARGYNFESDSDLFNAIDENVIARRESEEKVVKSTKEYKEISPELKKKITPFFRPSRKRVSRAFSLLGNKDTTVPLFSHVFKSWVNSGVDTIIEPYAGAFTLGTHSIKESIKAGLKRFDSNIFDKEKYILVRAIKYGKIENVKQAINKAIKLLNDKIIKYASAEPVVKNVIDEFLLKNPDSYVGSKQWYGFIRNKKIGKEVLVYQDDYNKFQKVFQRAFDDLYATEVNSIETAAINSLIKRIGIFGGKGQSLIRINGFRPFEDTIYNNKYGMVKAFDDINETFKLAKKHNTKINITNEDGAQFINDLKDVDSKKAAFYFDPPYVNSAQVYADQVSADEQAILEKFTSGEEFVSSHIKAFNMQKKGAKMALTNDVNEEYIKSVLGVMPDSKIFAYKEGNTPTSLMVSNESSEIISDYLTEAEKPAAERPEFVRIKELKEEKGLSIITVSNIRKGLGIKELKNATPQKIDELITFLEGLEYGDSLLTPMQREGLATLIKHGKFNKKAELITKREVKEKFMESDEILEGRITKYIPDIGFPTVDIKDGHPMITRVVDKADYHIRESNKKIEARDKKVHEMMKKAEQQTGLFKKKKVDEIIYKVMSGESVKLTKQEAAIIAYLRNFFKKVKLDFKLKRYRQYYIPHIEAKLMEKISRQGIVKALASYLKPRDLDIPTDILLALDNIIGSKKFFRFMLERKGGIQPTMNIRRIIHEYSVVVETKRALDKTLPEAQAVQQLLLQKRSALWMQKFLQNIKGRGLDWKFRQGKGKWAAKTADKTIDLGYIALLNVFNYWAPLKNIVGGEVTSFTYQTVDKYIKGKYRLARYPYRAYKVIRDSGILDGSFVDIIENNLIGKARSISNKLIYSLMQGGEYEIRGSFFLGELTNAEWKAGEITPKRFREIMDGLAITQGVYTKVDSPLFVQTVLGRSVAQFGRWKITNSLLLRRISKGAKAEIAEGNYYGKNMRSILKMFFATGFYLFLSFELGKRGYKKWQKIAQAGAELLMTIINTITLKNIYDALSANRALETMGAVSFNMQQLASYITGGIIEEPYKLEFKGGVEDLYYSGKNLIEGEGIAPKKKTDSKIRIPTGVFEQKKGQPKIRIPQSVFTR